jgi:hypothetical protein
MELVGIMNKALFFGLLFVSAGAAAEPAAPATDNPDNPNQVICRVSGETGSRLERQRVCMTRAQWAEHRRDTRQAVDHAQTSRVNRGSE